MGKGPQNPPHLARAAFAALVDRHQHALHTFLRGFTGNDEQARDLVQDTFHDAWRLAQAGTAPFVADPTEDDIRRWLFHTAYCKAISQLRRHRLVRWESLDAFANLMADDRQIPFEERIAEHEALRAALAQLSSDDVACLLLRVVQGFSAAEVGQIIGASAEVVTKRLSRAKQRLRIAYLDQIAAPEEHHVHE